MSVFLEVPSSDWVASNELAFAFRDRFPVSPGHTLVVTRRVVSDWFSATPEEQHALLALVSEVKQQLDEEFHADGYNVGFNAGAAAGQTVMHLHVHVIPRFTGDMDDPRGGVRHVIPSKGNYLQKAAPLSTGGEADPFLRHLWPLFHRACEIAIVAAFVQESGVRRLRPAIQAALLRGARIRLLTGDYLDITQASALEMLLDWQQVGVDSEERSPGTLETRVIEVASLPGKSRSFHPKSWRFESNFPGDYGPFGVAFVGSSNLSHSALDTGIEWNLRVDRDRDATAYFRIREAFEALWQPARALDAAWIEAYAQRARVSTPVAPVGEIELEPPPPLPEPHEVQREALEQLRQGRQQGRQRALVVLATGLGKTWLAAFDYRQLREELGRRPRLLFLAHRRELLRQAAGCYRQLLRQPEPGARVGFFVEDESDLSADLVFASVAKLARPTGLARLVGQSFDYVVVDEVHHAAASSYRRILGALDPRFLLGLTATPDRADAADILGLFDDHLAYEAGIARGIELGRLAPFHYLGLKDDIDYQAIPWGNSRFDPAELARAVETESRMETLWRAWKEHPGTRTLVFCCSIQHAKYVRAWLRNRGVRVAAVFSAEGTDEREASLQGLAEGNLDALCAVDIFNEGVDLPSLDRVILLRPTESPVVFLQQLGRGLRVCEGKSRVTVVDFVGNHRIFVERLRVLLSASGGKGEALRALLHTTSAPELPEGCSVELELEAKELLAKLFRVSGVDEVERAYRQLRFERGERPRAGELQRAGFLLSKLRGRHGSWFDFVRAEGDLSEAETEVFQLAGAFLGHIEIVKTRQCFEMVTLEAMLDAESLVAGLDLRTLALRCHSILRRSPDLFADVPEELRAKPFSPEQERRWLDFWKETPIAAWLGNRNGAGAWLKLDSGTFKLSLPLDVGTLARIEPTLSRMVFELVDYRLALYRARASARQSAGASQGVVCRVTWNKRAPILKLPDRAQVNVPEGETDVRLPDGSLWQFRMAKEFCNVARPAGTQNNRLAELLRGWFGPRAGQPGTAFQVRFYASPDGLWIEPFGVESEATRYPLATSVYLLAAEGTSPSPPRGTRLREEQLAPAFRQETLAVRTGQNAGQGFFFIEEKGILTKPDRLRPEAQTQLLQKSAHALARCEDGRWKYLGLARQRPEGDWELPEVDFETWRQWGNGRDVSRELPAEARERARKLAAEVLALPAVERWLTRPQGGRARVLGPSKQGGLRIDGGEGGFKERTASLADLGWVLLAQDHAAEQGGLLDEALVNRLRYLEGTPRESTRWIDTGWAIAACQLVVRR